MYRKMVFIVDFRVTRHCPIKKDLQMKRITITLLAFLLLHVQTPATHAQLAPSQQNYRNCINGYASCDLSQLNAAERARVQEASHQRNYNSCLHRYSSCDPSKLDETEITSIAKARNPNVTADSHQTPSAASTTTPHYYTNKDGIKVQSPTHYDSPPSGATAQCADGSYSFSLNHRGTCSHHGGVARWLD
jgi:hypothetical protein